MVRNTTFELLDSNIKIIVEKETGFDKNTQTGKRINTDQPITIGNHVWLGTQCFMTKGVTIGDNSIIGARSIVTKDVRANTLVVGTPAKEAKKNVS